LFTKVYFKIIVDIKNNEQPSKDYIKKGGEILKNRITLGGYRLAEFIKDIKKEYDVALNKFNKKKFLFPQKS
jgi:hypothetical protein